MVARAWVATFFIHLLLAGAAHAQTTGQYDFSYRIVGDRRVAPVQVFDDGRDTYVQFRSGQTVPAIFSIDQGGERLASHALQGSYVVIAGTTTEFLLRIGQVTASAQYVGSVRRAGVATTPMQADELSAVPSMQRGSPAFGAAGRPIAADTARFNMAGPGSAGLGVASSNATGPDLAGFDRPRSTLVFDAALADQNMRKVLARWARSAGWTFEPEHWTVDVDIPMAGVASFGTDFKAAVRQLLASTELSVRPLQPCFYSNQVLRVIALAERCDRTVAVNTR
jgi:hypothetical protein